MTAKRYHKLARAGMSILMRGNEKAGCTIYTASHSSPDFKTGPYRSYEEAWSWLSTIGPWKDVGVRKEAKQ